MLTYKNDDELITWLDTVKLNHDKPNMNVVELLKSKNSIIRETVIECLERNQVKKSVSFLIPLLNNYSVSVRISAVKAVGNLLEKKKFPKELLHVLDDKNELVRISAIEASSIIGDMNIVPFLEKKISDNSSLVRFYVYITLGEFHKNSSYKLLKNKIGLEKSTFAKLGIYEALFLFGDNGYLNKIISIMSSKSYRVRCAVINSLINLPLKKEEKKLVRDKIISFRKNEKTNAVKSLFEKLDEAIKIK